MERQRTTLTGITVLQNNCAANNCADPAGVLQSGETSRPKEAAKVQEYKTEQLTSRAPVLPRSPCQTAPLVEPAGDPAGGHCCHRSRRQQQRQQCRPAAAAACAAGGQWPGRGVTRGRCCSPLLLLLLLLLALLLLRHLQQLLQMGRSK